MDINTDNLSFPYSVVDHIGIVVKDMNSAVAFFKSLGYGPFKGGSSGGNSQRELPGKPVQEIQLNMQMFKIGQLRVELTQPIAGDTPQKNFLETRGEGIDHISFRVDDIEKEIDELSKKGFKVTYRVKFVPEGGLAFLQPDNMNGIAFELLQVPKRVQ